MSQEFVIEPFRSSVENSPALTIINLGFHQQSHVAQQIYELKQNHAADNTAYYPLLPNKMLGGDRSVTSLLEHGSVGKSI